jgi:hypothetical protein
MLHVEQNAKEILKRISDRNAAFKPDSPQILRALTLIGMRVSSLAKLKATQKGIEDSGHLKAATSYEFYKEGGINGVRVGTFGVRYAAMNEFGGRISPEQFRALCWAINEKHGRDYTPKGIINKGYWKPRPYLRPAFIGSRAYISDRIAEIFKGK